MNKKLITKKNQLKRQSTPFYRRKWVAITSVVLVFCLSLAGFLFVQFYKNKNQSKAAITLVLNSAKTLPGEVIYEEIKDEGCVTSSRGWFGNSTECGFSGKLIIKNSKNPDSDMSNLKSLLISSGYNEVKFSPGEFYGKDSGKNGTNILAHLLNAGGQKPEQGLSVKDAFGVDISVAQKEGEYVYGIVVTSDYLRL